MSATLCYAYTCRSSAYNDLVTKCFVVMDWYGFRLNIKLFFHINSYPTRNTMFPCYFSIIKLQANTTGTTDTKKPSYGLMLTIIVRCLILTHCDQVKGYADIDLDYHWLGQLLVFWRKQNTAWSDIYLASTRFSGIHFRKTYTWILYISVVNVCFKCICIFQIKTLLGDFE